MAKKKQPKKTEPTIPDHAPPLPIEPVAPIVSTTEVEKKLDVADNALTKFGIILKKHWGKLLFILLAYLVYQFCVLVKESMDQDVMINNQTEQTMGTPMEEPTYSDQTEDVSDTYKPDSLTEQQ